MRYYLINIKDNTGKIIQKYSSRKSNGTPDPGALSVLLDIPVFNYDTPLGSPFARVFGIGSQQVGQSSNFNGKNMEVFAGMDAGLPLANPGQAGLIARGTVYQAIGNWQGIEQTLDFYFIVGTGSKNAPANIVLNWVAGMKMSTALKNCLSIAFPSLTIQINISDRLVLPEDQIGVHENLTQLAQYIDGISKNIIKDTGYNGVKINIKDNKLVIYDGTSLSNPRKLSFNDFIGQPVWKGPELITFQLVMRADLSVGDYVVLPQQPVTVTPQGFSRYQSNLFFQGTFLIKSLRHLGDFKQPDASSWITIVEAVTTGDNSSGPSQNTSNKLVTGVLTKQNK